ncbi:MAG: methionine-R-sulfoxide reductase [Aureliella sp.]
MFRRQTLWLTGWSVVLCGGLTWWSFQAPDAAERGQATAGTPAALTQVSTAAEDSDKAEKTSTPAKRTKKVSSQRGNAEVQYNKLSPAEAHILLHKGTERPWTGEYTNLKDPGTYICKRCNAPLYHSDTKFESHCGWPCFYDEIMGAVIKRPETDGTGRVEIVCANCGGHLGHVFYGEGFTAKNTRHCVNSKSMTFIAKGKPLPKVIKPESKEDKETEKASESGDSDIKSESSKETGAAKPGT